MPIRLAALVVAFVVPHAAVQVSDVRVMSSGATAPAFLQLVAPFESATKLKAVTLALPMASARPTSRRGCAVARPWMSCSCRMASWTT